MHYINPGNSLFDTVVKVIRQTCREDMLKGTTLVSPDDKDDYLAFFVKSQILDNRSSKQNESIADEQLLLVTQDKDGNFCKTSAAKFLDLHPPTEFAKLLEPPQIVSTEDVIKGSFNEISLALMDETSERVAKDAAKRHEYLETAFTHVIVDLQSQTSELQGKVLLGDTSVQEKIQKNQIRIGELLQEKKESVNGTRTDDGHFTENTRSSRQCVCRAFNAG